jgi:hypothetical protein
MAIQAKVAQILSDTTLVLNVGSAAGVREGTRFLIYQNGKEILDPQTGVPLGTVEIVKATVEVDHVQEKLCVVTTLTKIVKREKEVPMPHSAYEIMFGRRREVTFEESVPQKIKVETKDPDYPSQLVVKVGDLARSVD